MLFWQLPDEIKLPIEFPDPEFQWIEIESNKWKIAFNSLSEVSEACSCQGMSVRWKDDQSTMPQVFQ
jgi:hypothetical protein